MCPQAVARLAIAKPHGQVPAEEVQNGLCESIIFTEGHTVYHTRYHTTHTGDAIFLGNQNVKHFNNRSYVVSDYGSDPACDTEYQTSYHTVYQFITPSIRPYITPRTYHTKGHRLYHTAYQTPYHTNQLSIAPTAYQ